MTTASPGSGGPGSGASAFDSDRIAQIIQQYAEGEKEGYDSASVIRDHTDTMLTWILGLMAAGIVAGHPVLKSVPIAARWAALAPWLVGIAIAVAGRLIAHEIRGRESIWHFE